jgi:uncharacterized protein YpmB
MDLYKIFALIGVLFLVIGLSKIYRFIIYVKIADPEKTVEEAGVKELGKNYHQGLCFGLY